MIETALLNLVRRHWWLLALLAYVAWTIESAFAGNGMAREYQDPVHPTTP